MRAGEIFKKGFMFVVAFDVALNILAVYTFNLTHSVMVR